MSEPKKVSFLLKPQLQKLTEEATLKCGISRTELLNQSLAAALDYITSKKEPAKPSEHLAFYRKLFHITIEK